MGVLDQIGGTPLVTIEGLFIKLECSNPGGSVKDRIAKFLLQEAVRRGELTPGDTVVEATSGNTGIAVSMVCRELGYEAIIYMPEHMSRERRRMLEALGAEVRLTPREEGFEGPIERRDKFCGKAGYYVPDQFSNPDNIRCHELTTGAEILQQLGSHLPDALVAGVGTGGTLMGVARALRKKNPKLTVVAVEPIESNVMSGGCAGDHGIQGIGDGFVPALVDMAAVDEVVAVATEDARAEAESIRKKYGYCVGMSSGANSVAAKSLRDRFHTVVTVWPDCSNRYVSMGLQSPDSADVRCPLRAVCCERSRRLLAGSTTAP